MGDNANRFVGNGLLYCKGQLYIGYIHIKIIDHHI